jgi:hypothetical protein
VLTCDDDRVLEVLGDAECRRLLATARLGRLGFNDGALPAIVPVPFTLGEGTVVIQADPDHAVLGAMRGSVVAFAVDSYDVDARLGWGVTVIGPIRAGRPRRQRHLVVRHRRGGGVAARLATQALDGPPHPCRRRRCRLPGDGRLTLPGCLAYR